MMCNYVNEGRKFFFVGLEASGPVTVRNAVFSHVAPCSDVKTAGFFFVKRRYSSTRIHGVISPKDLVFEILFFLIFRSD